MRKNAIIALTLGFGLFTLPASAENVVGQVLTVRALDKVTAQTADYDIKVGEMLEYGSLSVTVRHCERTPEEEAPETFAFLQIEDKRLDGGGEDAEPVKVFSGWMFGSNPALSALEHPVYDIWPLACKTTGDTLRR